jgi:hypothetical protein
MANGLLGGLGRGVSGLWAGEYSYLGEHGGPWGTSVAVPFHMTLRASKTGRIAGTVNEDPRLGFSEEGSLLGQAYLRKVTLTKHMPLLRVWEPGRLLTFAELVERRSNGRYSAPPLRHPPVLLEGRLSRRSGTMEGIWTLEPFTLELDDDPEWPDWRGHFPRQTGEWRASRLCDAT